MAKSRRESLLLNVVRGFSLVHDPEGVALQSGEPHSPRGREQCLARARNTRFRHCEERSDEAISKWAA